MQQTQDLKAFILGASGAVGRELVLELVKSPKWSKVTVLVRRKLEEWDKLDEAEKQKLQILLTDSLDSLEDTSKHDLSGFSSVFCCLGQYYSDVPVDVYRLVNCTYPYSGAKLAAHYKVPHYSLISGMGIDSKSWFSSLKMRGEMEDKLLDLKLPHLSILKPALITERREGQKFIEKVGKYLFFPQIPAKQVAAGARIDAELQHTTPYKSETIIYSNSEIKTLVQTGQYPEKK